MAGLDPAIYRGTQMAGSKPGHDMNIGHRFLARREATRQSRPSCAQRSRLPRRFAPNKKELRPAGAKNGGIPRFFIQVGSATGRYGTRNDRAMGRFTGQPDTAQPPHHSTPPSPDHAQSPPRPGHPRPHRCPSVCICGSPLPPPASPHASQSPHTANETPARRSTAHLPTPSCADTTASANHRAQDDRPHPFNKPTHDHPAKPRTASPSHHAARTRAIG